MSFKIDDKTWIPQSTSEHAEKWMEDLNTLLAENNVKDESGNIIQLSQNFANALYLFIVAGSNRVSVNDEKLQKAINSFNVELCDNEQIENLLPIAAISRNSGSFSTLVLTCTASADGQCVIPAGTKAPFGDVNFVVQTMAVIGAGETQNIETVCDTVGAYSVLKNEINAFETQIPNLETVTNNVSSVPGSSEETTDSLRRRIIRGQTVPYSIDGVKYALEELQGINHARVFFNYNTESIYTLQGGIELQPRTAYIVINGKSDKLAKTYTKYMSAPTQNAPNASPTGTYTTVEIFVTAQGGDAVLDENTTFTYSGVEFKIDAPLTVEDGTTESETFTAVEVGAITVPAGYITHLDQQIANIASVTNAQGVAGVPKTAYEQDYVTGSGQLIPIKYDVAQDVNIFVKVFLEVGDNNDSQEIRNQVKRDLISASAEWTIGQAITSLITSKPFAEITYTTVAYTKVSLDGENWTDRIEVASNVIPRVSDSTIVIGNVSQ